MRLSGPDAWRIATRLTGRALAPDDAGRFVRVTVRRPGDTTPADDGLMLVFRAPRSYTGEDAIEFQGHGGTVAPRRVLEACLAAGARLANRGEFTLRAFLAGKLDLSEAEAVIDLVDARNTRAADDAFARLSGGLSERYEVLYADAIALSSRIEHALDVDEGDLPAQFVPDVLAGVAALRSAIVRLVAGAREGRILRDGALVVLAGAPNAGKSSLLNALVGERRAIVSDVAGTTRDTIEVNTEIGGWPVRLADTAGLRATSDAIEAEGVSRAGGLIARADLVVALDCDIAGALRVHAKCDLDGAPGVSAKTGAGLDALKAGIARRLDALAATGREENGADVTTRQRELLEAALRALDLACDDAAGRTLPANGEGADLTLLANGVRSAAEAIGRIVGKTYSDDMLDALFSRFCVGK